MEDENKRRFFKYAERLLQHWNLLEYWFLAALVPDDAQRRGLLHRFGDKVALNDDNIDILNVADFKEAVDSFCERKGDLSFLSENENWFEFLDVNDLAKKMKAEFSYHYGISRKWRNWIGMEGIVSTCRCAIEHVTLYFSWRRPRNIIFTGGFLLEEKDRHSKKLPKINYTTNHQVTTNLPTGKLTLWSTNNSVDQRKRHLINDVLRLFPARATLMAYYKCVIRSFSLSKICVVARQNCSFAKE